MPVNAPEFGEVWTTSDATSGRIMQGIVAEVTSTRVLFVSLTGNRVAVPRARLGTTWNFVQPTPRRTMPACKRLGCSHGGMIQYDRAGVSSGFEYVCPKHSPTGVQCRITVDFDPSADASRTIRPGFECRSSPCPNCGHTDPSEDVRLAAFPARLWCCSACDNRWMTLPVVQDEVVSVPLFSIISSELARCGYQEENIVVLLPDSWKVICQNERVARQTTERDVVVLPTGTQATFLPTAFTEQIRTQFHAIVRVRAHAARHVERPVQRLGGAPNGGPVPVQDLGRLRTSYNPFFRPFRPPAAPAGASDAAAAAEILRRLRRLEDEQVLFSGPTSTQEPVSTPEVKIERDSLWVQRASGEIIEVIETLKATDGSDVVS